MGGGGDVCVELWSDILEYEEIGGNQWMRCMD
jgi:hypothetical protein